MFRIVKQHLLGYIFELIIAIAIYYFLGLVALLIYIYIMLVIKIDVNTDYLRKLIRVFQLGNEVKITAIIRKLKITNQEITNVTQETKGNLSEEQWISLEKDAKDIIS